MSGRTSVACTLFMVLLPFRASSTGMECCPGTAHPWPSFPQGYGVLGLLPPGCLLFVSAGFVCIPGWTLGVGSRIEEAGEPWT